MGPVVSMKVKNMFSVARELALQPTNPARAAPSRLGLPC